jgi:hypothetical protein
MQFELQTGDFRALNIPYTTTSGKNARLGICYVDVEAVPAELRDWLGVNPRTPKLDKKEHLRGPVAKAIVSTLEDDPDMMCVRNNGITVLVDSMEFQRVEGGAGVLKVTLTDKTQHGIVNGGHTFHAIRQVVDDPERVEPVGAQVRMHFVQGLSPKHIADVAEGMNRSLQVDDKSLENLRGTFDEIEKALRGKPGADQIAYRQGDPGEVDILFVLTVMAMLDLNEYPDRRKHPHSLFGQQKAVLDKFVNEVKDPNAGFRRMLPCLHEILRLTDEIQKGVAGSLGRLKVSQAKKGNRVASPKNKSEPAYFAGGRIGGHVPVGFLYPIVASFRANIDPEKWAEGKFVWLTDPFKLMDEMSGELAEIIKQEHKENNGKPAEVGRKEAAYRGCYSVIMMELASRGLL